MEKLEIAICIYKLSFKGKDCFKNLSSCKLYGGRGPHGMRQSELGQDRNVAALRTHAACLKTISGHLSIPTPAFCACALWASHLGEVQ